jgi:hypothetical protein
VTAGLVLGQRVRQLFGGHDVPHRDRLRRIGTGPARGAHHRGRQQVRERQPVEQHRDHQGHGHQGADRLRPDEQRAQRPAVGEHAAGQAQHRSGGQAGERHRTGAGGRPGGEQGEERIGDRGHAAAERRRGLPAPEQHEVAVAPQR